MDKQKSETNCKSVSSSFGFFSRVWFGIENDIVLPMLHVVILTLEEHLAVQCNGNLETCYIIIIHHECSKLFTSSIHTCIDRTQTTRILMHATKCEIKTC